MDLVARPAVEPDAVNPRTRSSASAMDFRFSSRPAPARRRSIPTARPACTRRATAAGTPMIISNVSSQPVEKMATPPPVRVVPVLSDARASRRAGRCCIRPDRGATPIVVTVDQQATLYERTHDGISAATSGGLKARTPLPRHSGEDPYRVPAPALVRVDVPRRHPAVHQGADADQRRADRRGCAALGRARISTASSSRITADASLDYGPSTLEVLPEIVAPVGGRIPVLVDSGFRRALMCQGDGARRRARSASGGPRAGRLAHSARPACNGCWRCFTRKSRDAMAARDARRSRISTVRGQDEFSVA